MIITIGKPGAISEKGGRVNNEDTIHPLPEINSSNQKLYLVCDGVGGSEKGEVASSLACESFQSYFSTFLEGDPTPEFIQKAVQYTETRFDDYIVSHPEATGMGTTLTMVYFGTSGVTLAHIGDSRIYQFRKGKILYQTEDHSLVNSLIKLKEITPEEAIKHPQRNVILRAIQGTGRPTEADVVQITDVQPGDYFFLCTDGVLERFNNETFSAVFEHSVNSEEIKDKIVEQCNNQTRDNYSFYILPIQNVQETVSIGQNIRSFLYSFI